MPTFRYSARTGAGDSVTGTVSAGNQAEALGQLRDPESGEPMIESVYKREHIYSGECYPQAADLVAMPHRGYDLKGSIKKEVLTDRGVIVGAHTYDDAMIYVQGQNIKKEEAAVVDVMPTILHLMDAPIPDDLDGSVLI